MATSRTRPKTEQSARNNDYTDREILGIIDELCRADPEGLATSTEIAIKMGFSTNGNKHKTPAVKIAGRLAWMRDYGQLEGTKPAPEDRRSGEPGSHDTRWCLTTKGREILGGRLTKPVTSALERMGAGDKVLLAKELMRTAWIEADPGTAFALDRQIKHDRSKRAIRIRG